MTGRVQGREVEREETDHGYERILVNCCSQVTHFFFQVLGPYFFDSICLLHLELSFEGKRREEKGRSGRGGERGEG